MQFQISYPVKPYIINQLFGNKDPKYTSLGLPGHNGIDFYAKHGQPIYATHDGLASFQIDPNGGCGVVIVSDKEYDDGNGEQCYYKTIYWHLCNSHKEPKYKSPLEDKTGFTPVKLGDLIGYADNTGFSTGDHLHFGVKQVAKGEEWGTWYNLNQNNGYQGAIDPMPFFDKVFAEDVVLMRQQITLLQKVVELYKQYIAIRG